MTGAVQFTDNGVVIRTCRDSAADGYVPVGSGDGKPPSSASCDLTYRQPGSHTFNAVYRNDNYSADAQSSPLTLTVSPSTSGRLASCVGQDQSFSTANLTSARGALVCLVDRVRGRFGLNALPALPALDAGVQRHALRESRPPGSDRVDGLLGDVLGDRTPYSVIASMMANVRDCKTILAQANEIGIGVVTTPLFSQAPVLNEVAWAGPPTWTVELVGTDAVAPSDVTAARRCPHPRPSDAAGDRAAPRYLLPGGGTPITTPFDLQVRGAQAGHGVLDLGLVGESSEPVSARLTITIGSGRHRFRRMLTVVLMRRHADAVRRIEVGAQALRRPPHGPLLVTVSVAERTPRAASYLFEIGV